MFHIIEITYCVGVSKDLCLNNTISNHLVKYLWSQLPFMRRKKIESKIFRSNSIHEIIFINVHITIKITFSCQKMHDKFLKRIEDRLKFFKLQ